MSKKNVQKIFKKISKKCRRRFYMTTNHFNCQDHTGENLLRV